MVAPHRDRYSELVSLSELVSTQSRKYILGDLGMLEQRQRSDVSPASGCLDHLHPDQCATTSKSDTVSLETDTAQSEPALPSRCAQTP